MYLEKAHILILYGWTGTFVKPAVDVPFVVLRVGVVK